MKKNFWVNLFLVLVGVVLGSLVTYLCRDVAALSWLSFGQVFGTSAPVSIDLGIINFTVGISINITVATVLCIAISLIVGRFFRRK